MTAYLTEQKQWDKLINYILSHDEPIGWDTEFDGVDFDNGDNCIGRSILDVWSLALYDGEYHPRGYRTARACVLPAVALPYFKPVLSNTKIKKAAHNASVDVHTAWNVGVDVTGVIDTLSLARYVLPGRMLYGLDVLGRELLDIGKFIKFKDLFSEPVMKTEVVKKCWCDVPNCKKRKYPHEKYYESVLVETKKRSLIACADVGPTHPKWNDKLEYSAQDAVLALSLYDYLITKLEKKTYENPFEYSNPKGI